MAERLDSFPASQQSRYPWDEWLDGSPWRLMKGQDFQSATPTFRANAQIQAKKRDGRIRSRAIKTDGHEALVIQFLRADA
jgi:hypothetical protein